MFGWKLFRRPAQIENVQEKNNLSYTMNLGWKQDVGGVNQDISRVEGCVLKEEIVFVWLELVQKASPNSSCTTDYSFLDTF